MLAAEWTTPKTGRIPARLVFTTGDDPYQWLIRFGSGSPTSHVAIALGPQGEWLLHAHEDGIQINPRRNWLGITERLVAEFLILPDVTDGIKNMLSYVGEPYDVPIDVMTLRLLHFLGSPLHRWVAKRKNDRSQMCARFVLELDPFGAKIPEWQHIDPATVSPDDLLQAAVGPSFIRIA